MRKATKADKEEAKQDLLSWLPRGSKVYTICRAVTRSGMGAWYSVVIFVSGATVGEAHSLHPSWSVHALTGRRMKDIDGRAALWMGGCGYDRAATLVEDIARELYGDGRALRHESL